MRASLIFTVFALAVAFISTLALGGDKVCERDFKCLESRVVGQYPALFVRDGQKLVVHNAGQAAKMYLDGVDMSPQYLLIQYHPEINYAILYAGYPESPWFIFLDTKTGLETKVKGWPLISPDQERFVVSHIDLEFNNDSVLQVYRVTDLGLDMEFDTTRVEGDIQWGPSSPSWLSSTELKFTRNRLMTPDELEKRPKRCANKKFESGDECYYISAPARLSCTRSDEKANCSWLLNN